MECFLQHRGSVSHVACASLVDFGFNSAFSDRFPLYRSLAQILILLYTIPGDEKKERKERDSMEQNENIASEITLLNMKQVMSYLNVSQWIYYKLVNSRQLPTITLGSRKLVRLKALKEYLDSVETKAKGTGGFF